MGKPSSLVAVPKPPGSSTRPNLYLLGHPMVSHLSFQKLPKGKALLQRLHGLNDDETKLTRDNEKAAQKDMCADKLVEEIVDVWRLHFGIRSIDGKEFEGQEKCEKEKIMIIRNVSIKEKILAMDKKYSKTEYESRRVKKRKNFEETEKALLELLDTPLNILKTGCWRTLNVEGQGKQRVWLPSGEEILASNGIISLEEELAHLKNQLTKEQPGCCKSLDMKQAKKDQRKLKDELKLNERVKQDNGRKQTLTKTTTEMFEETEDSGVEEDDDVEFLGPKKKARKRINMMGPMSASADRANLSCRDMALMGAAAAKAMGLKVKDTNCSVTTAHRQRTQLRLKLVEEIRNAWTAPDAGSLHWDGKTLKMRRGKSGNFIAIYFSGVKDGEPSHLLGIPMAPGGTGKEEFEVVKETLERRRVTGKQVVALVFDTTLSNTGQWEGVCR